MTKPSVNQVYLAFNRFHQECFKDASRARTEADFNRAAQPARDQLEKRLKELGILDAIDMDWSKD